MCYDAGAEVHRRSESVSSCVSEGRPNGGVRLGGGGHLWIPRSCSFRWISISDPSYPSFPSYPSYPSTRLTRLNRLTRLTRLPVYPSCTRLPVLPSTRLAPVLHPSYPVWTRLTRLPILPVLSVYPSHPSCTRLAGIARPPFCPSLLCCSLKSSPPTCGWVHMLGTTAGPP